MGVDRYMAEKSILKHGPMKQVFVDIVTAAKMSGLSQMQIRRYIDRGEIKSALIGRKLFVVNSSMSQWIKKRLDPLSH